MTSNLINARDIMPASQIIDYFTGDHMFYVENPFFDVKGVDKVNKNNFLQYKEITNGGQLTEPEIYAKINGKFTKDFKIKLFSNNKPCRLFGPYSATGEQIKIKSTNKFMVNLGKPDENDTEQRMILLLNQQLSVALDFLMVSKLLEIDIQHGITDVQFINMVAEKLKFDDEEKINELVEKLNSKSLAIYEKSDIADPTEIGLLDIMKDNIDNYIKKYEPKDQLRKNPVFKFFKGKFRNAASPMPTVKITRSLGINKQTNEEQAYDNVTAKFGFILLLKGGKNGMFATKTIKGKQLMALEYEEYMGYVENKSKKDCNFITTLKYDIRTFQSGSIAGTKMDVIQCIIKECKMVDEPIMFDLDEYDEMNDEIQTTFE